MSSASTYTHRSRQLQAIIILVRVHSESYSILVMRLTLAGVCFTCRSSVDARGVPAMLCWVGKGGGDSRRPEPLTPINTSFPSLPPPSLPPSLPSPLPPSLPPSPVVYPRPDRNLRLREKLLHRHGHHVRRCVPNLEQLLRPLICR